MKQAILLVGHTELSQGARTYNGQGEWAFNKIVAEKVVALANFPLVLHTKNTWDSLENSLKREGHHYDLSVELHLNSYSAEAFGCEALAFEHHEKSIAAAAQFATKIFLKHGIKRRHVTGVLEVGKGGRGRMNLKTMLKYADAAIIVEPAFVNFKTHEAQEIVENPDKYAATIAEAIGEYLK